MKTLVLLVPEQDEARLRELLAKELPQVALLPRMPIPEQQEPNFEPNAAAFRAALERLPPGGIYRDIENPVEWQLEI